MTIFRDAIALLLFAVVLTGCQDVVPPSSSHPEVPVAKKVNKELTLHGDVRIDPYYWLNERDNPEVIQYLEEENAYTEAMMDPTRELQSTLVQEFEDARNDVYRALLGIAFLEQNLPGR